jgi:C4-dicarboxylate transporter DctM subunit
MTLILPVVFFLMLAVGVPIAFTIGLTSALGIWDLGFDMSVVPQRLLGGIDTFVLLSVPLFVLAADLMERSGITEDLINLTNRTIGRVNGGLGYSNIVAGTFMGGISGAAVADTTAFSKIFVPAMEKAGYDRGYSAALTAIASLQAPLVPPSIIAIIYGAAMGVSIGALFAGAMLPGILLGISAMIIHGIWCRGKELKGPAERAESWLKIIARSIPALLMPVLILGGILGGIFTPTEAASVAVGYAAVFGSVVRRRLTFKDFSESLGAAARVSAQVLIIIGMAAVMSWLLAMFHIPALLSDFLLSITTNKVLLLLMTNACFLVVGCFMEPSAAIILFTPILISLIDTLGIHPVHFGIMIIVNLTIGMVTPPVGTVLYATSAAAKVDVGELSLKMLPFILMAIVLLLIIAFVPAISLALPSALGLI